MPKLSFTVPKITIKRDSYGLERTFREIQDFARVFTNAYNDIAKAINQLFTGVFSDTYVWDDEISPLGAAPSPGSAPGLTLLNGGPYKGRTFSVGDQLQVEFHVKHTTKPGSPMYFHVHWCTDGTNAASVTWRFHHQIAIGHDQAAFPTATVVDLVTTASTTAWQHQITEVSDGQAITAPEVDALILVVLELQAASGLGTPADNVFGLYVDIHYQTDRNGTPSKAPDFYV